MNGQVWVELAIGVTTVFLSVIGSAVVIAFFLGGMKVQLTALQNQVSHLPDNWKQEISPVIERLAKIEGMFTLVPREGSEDAMRSGRLGFRKQRR